MGEEKKTRLTVFLPERLIQKLYMEKSRRRNMSDIVAEALEKYFGGEQE